MSENLLTIKDMAEKFSEPPKRIDYLIAKHRIKEARRVGQARVFDERGQAAIKEALFNIRVHRD